MFLPSFPAADAIPPAARLDATRWSLRYLVVGRVRAWPGPASDVLSPICFDEGGALRRAVIGRAPLLDEAEALAALAAATRAWDHGRGQWPTMSVAARIAAVEKFVAAMA